MYKSLVNIPGVGKQREKEFKKLGLASINDLLYYFPRRYEDRSQLKPLNLLEDNTIVTVLGVIKKVEIVSPKRNMSILKLILENCTGKITATFFNQKFLKNKLKPGTKIFVTGKVNLGFGRQIIVSEYELFEEDDDPKHTARIVPIYSGTQKLNQKFLRNTIFFVLEKYLSQVKEILPTDIKNKFGLLSLNDALQEIHYPSTWDLQKRARYRLVFQELLILQLGIKNTRLVIENKKGIEHSKNGELIHKLENSLPFSLTKAQKNTILEIQRDMESTKIMYRLVQGDVGSGKTVVATWALVKAISGGYQGALMAPTEILAEQHHESLSKILNPLGLESILLKGGLPKKEKELKLEAISEGKAKLVIGTQALIQSEVTFKNLGLVVIDEQHRFGVRQRVALQEKGLTPDCLVMTATPIPRTLALTLYGDMDLSVIDQSPPGRKVVKTYHVNEKMRGRIYNFIRKEVKKGYQVYIVCPLVEESEKLDLENATKLATKLQNMVFPDLKIGLIHGKLPVNDKETIMENFRKGLVEVLVTTTVIEVGVDVLKATLIVIENAERFGLAQLHQLRGRVGRGKEQGYCILISEPKTLEAQARMRIMTESTDGFLIAEEDLKLRGPGEIFGHKQHGLPDLKIADLLRDGDVLEQTKYLALEILKEGFHLPKYQALYEHTMEKFKNIETISG